MQTENWKNHKAVAPSDREAWRRWLEKNHNKEKAVWLIIFRKSSKTSGVPYAEAIEEALCFGWIDSVANKRDDESFYLYFTQRKAKSNWSTVNRKRAEKMIAEGRMHQAGQAMIDLAKKTGTWKAIVSAERNKIPPDLKSLLEKNKTAGKNFDAFPPSAKRAILEWILNAKQPETRQKRIEETVRKAAENIRANQYQRKTK